MKAADRKAIVDAGRAHLRAWLESAERHGTIYYNVPHVARSGMSRRTALATIVTNPHVDRTDPRRQSQVGRVILSTLWPQTLDTPGFTSPGTYSEALDIVAKDWGFSFKHRAFVVGGCGMDMVFALIDDLAGKVGLDDRSKGGKGMYANRVKRESFG